MQLPPGVALVPMVDSNEDSGDLLISVRRLSAMARARVSRDAYRTQETLSSSDLAYMTDLIDRGTMVSYMDETVPITYTTLGKRRDTIGLVHGSAGQGTDYRLNAARLIDRVLEGGMYRTIDPSQESYSARTYKFGVIWPVTWESWLTDGRDLGLLRDFPESWGLSARYTQQYLFTSGYAYNTTLFTAGHGNLLELPLTGANLGTAITTIRNFTDPAGNVSVYAGPLYLVVPSSLEWTARPLVESTIVTTGSTTPTPVNNPAFRSVTVVVDPFLDSLDTTYGTTGWYLFCDPRFRPAMRYGFLRGYEQPQIFVRESDARLMLGGGSDPFDGGFDADEIRFKCRFTFGVDEVDWRGALMSTGVEAKS